ncbi:alpha/beta hydrolase family esterase [Nocardia sp. NPDC059228]|uniref:alpha/beta hydrolase family esterase n=1 Tax=Nocardia sp. NPDC059228 TaxID=3346777 RepID=UPI0036C082B2
MIGGDARVRTHVFVTITIRAIAYWINAGRPALTRRSSAMSSLRVGSVLSTFLTVVGLIVAVLVPIGPIAGVASAAGCTLTPTGGTVPRMIGTRSYTLNVPQGLTGSAVGLLISLHGTGDTSAGIERETGWSSYAAAHNFIVAYPQGTEFDKTWHFEQGSVDVTFLKQVVTDIESTWCVDTHRVYADGWSDGAIMSQRMACDAADLFAAVTSWEGTDPTDPNPLEPSAVGTPCTPSRPIAVGIFQGAFDPISNLVVGLANVRDWTRRNRCPATADPTSDRYGTHTNYQPCAAGTNVAWRVEYNTTHQWPTGAIGQDLRDQLWNFLDSRTLP